MTLSEIQRINSNGTAVPNKIYSVVLNNNTQYWIGTFDKRLKPYIPSNITKTSDTSSVDLTLSSNNLEANVNQMNLSDILAFAASN